jgi:hypothetical protein
MRKLPIHHWPLQLSRRLRYGHQPDRVTVIGAEAAIVTQAARPGRGSFRPLILGCVTGQLVRADVGASELVGGDWRLALERPIERARRVDSWDRDDGWLAVLGIRRELKLQVSGHDGQPEAVVEAWAGEPGESTDGVAVIRLADGGLAVARVPLCGCGVRGCGNAGVQLSKTLPGSDLPALAGLLRALPWTQTAPTREGVLRGDGLAALPVRRPGKPSKVVYHGATPVNGVTFPVTHLL